MNDYSIFFQRLAHLFLEFSVAMSYQSRTQSQDSGVDAGGYSSDFSQPAAPAYLRPPPSFAGSGRRTLARPPSCPSVGGAGVTESSGRFSRVSDNSQDSSESQILKDLQQHLHYLDEVIVKNSQTMFAVVKESVGFCQGLMNNEDGLKNIFEDLQKISVKIAADQQDLVLKINNVQDLVKEMGDMISAAEARHEDILCQLEALAKDKSKTGDVVTPLPTVRLANSLNVKVENDDIEDREESISLLENEP